MPTKDTKRPDLNVENREEEWPVISKNVSVTPVMPAVYGTFTTTAPLHQISTLRHPETGELKPIEELN